MHDEEKAQGQRRKGILMPTGRPTLYDPAYCETAIAYMAQGYSTTALAGHLRVSRDTIYEWAAKHPAFSDALNVARAVAAEYWENRLQDVASGKDGNAAACIFALKNRAAADWREVVRQEHSGPEGGPIQTEEVGAKDRLAAFLRDRSTKSE